MSNPAVLRAAEAIEAEDDAGLIVYAICEVAKRIFDAAECPDDFCLQLAGGEVLVFGGTNRLKWDAENGFYADESYCSGAFLAAVDMFNKT